MAFFIRGVDFILQAIFSRCEALRSFSYFGPQSADLARDLFPLAVTFVTSESLEAAEEGDGVLATSGNGDSVRQGTIVVVD